MLFLVSIPTVSNGSAAYFLKLHPPRAAESLVCYSVESTRGQGEKALVTPNTFIASLFSACAETEDAIANRMRILAPHPH